MSEDKNREQAPQETKEGRPISSVTPLVKTIRGVWLLLRRPWHIPRMWLSLGIVAFLSLALFFTVSQVGQRQDIRRKAATAGVRLTLVPSQITASANTEYIVAITIDTGMEMVSAADLRLSFDSSKLEIQSVSPGDFLPVVLVQGRVVNGTASITLGSQPTKPKKGSGVLASLKIKSLGQTTSITFSDATQVAAIGKTQSVVEEKNGVTITVESVPSPLPTVSPQPSPTAPPSSPTPEQPDFDIIEEQLDDFEPAPPAQSSVQPTPTPVPRTGGFSRLLTTPTPVLVSPTVFVPPAELTPLPTTKLLGEPAPSTPEFDQEALSRPIKTGYIFVDRILAFLKTFCRYVRFCK